MPERKPRRGSDADTFPWSLRPGRTLAVLVVAGLGVLLSTGLSLAADAKFVSFSEITSITGPPDFDYVGTFNIDIGPPFDGPLTEAYCVDIHHPIDIGDVEPQVTPDYPCQVVYILNTYYPHAAPVLVPTSHEAAAVQAAIWFFTDGYVIGGPADIKTRAEVIIADAQGSNCVPVPVVPQSLALTPPSATNFLPLDTTHSVLATLIGSDTLPMANYPITIDVTGVSGPQSFSGTTDGSGQFTINYTNTSAVAGSDTITAHVTFTVPVGLKFKLIDKQGIVLAGDPVTGTVQGSAQKNWVPAACGDGFINQDGELCDDGNLIDGDDCDSNCTPTGCGNGIPTAGELCDDGNLIDGDGCDSNCTPTGCGNGIPTAGELCDDGNQVNGDGCDNNCTTTACGNGVVTPPELCEDGNQVNGDGCEADCTLPRCGNGIVDPFDPADPDRPGESCDDGNQLGCDPLHPSRPVKGDSCSNSCQGLICKDPSKIRLVDRGLDQFKAHGVLVPMANAPINFSNGHVSLALTTPPATPPEQSGAGALVFETSLPPGAVGARSNGGFKYKNLDAKQNGGIYQLTATPTNYGTFKVTIISYGNLSAAESDMITHIWVGGVQWTVHALWRQTNTGWVFQHTLP